LNFDVYDFVFLNLNIKSDIKWQRQPYELIVYAILIFRIQKSNGIIEFKNITEIVKFKNVKEIVEF